MKKLYATDMANNKILLAIPSKNRVRTLQHFTFPWINETTVGDIKIFVEPQDYEKYEARFLESMLVSLSENDQGLGFAKEEIKRYAISGGYDYIFKIDDDIRGFMDFRKNLKLPEAKALFFDQMTTYLVKTLEKHEKLKCICFPYDFELYEKQEWEKTRRVMSAYLCKTEAFHADRRLSVFEDWGQGISILANNGEVLKYGLTGQDMGVEVGKGTGGHQDFDRAAKALQEVAILREIYPPLKFKGVYRPWRIEPDVRSIKI